MTWNYRVVRKTFKTDEGTEGHSYGVHEVYYNEDGHTPKLCTKNSIEPYGETEEELVAQFKTMAKAFNKPVLDYDNDFLKDVSCPCCVGEIIGELPVDKDDLSLIPEIGDID